MLGDPDRAAAQIARGYAGTWQTLSKKGWRWITHEEAIEMAIEDWLDLHPDAKPAERPDPEKVRELLRKGRALLRSRAF